MSFVPAEEDDEEEEEEEQEDHVDGEGDVGRGEEIRSNEESKEEEWSPDEEEANSETRNGDNTEADTSASSRGELVWNVWAIFFFSKNTFIIVFLGFCPQVVFLLAVQGEDEGEKGAKGEERDHKV